MFPATILILTFVLCSCLAWLCYKIERSHTLKLNELSASIDKRIEAIRKIRNELAKQNND